MDETLLAIRNLSVTFASGRTPVHAVQGVSFSVGREKVGIVGESGSGKSVTGRAILHLLPPSALVQASELRYRGQDLLAASEQQLRRIRGKEIAMILQDPKYSLNPVRTVGEQIREACAIHHRDGRREGHRRALAMLAAVRIRDPERVYNLYPHEVSGGMGQRIMIAMMLVAGPRLLVADEPTSALDVTVQLQVLAILDDLVTSRGMGLIFISHDLELVASFCDRIVIMYGGRVMETLAAADLHASTHPYTRGLLDCLPRIGGEQKSLPTLTRDEAWLRTASGASSGCERE